MNDDYEFFKSEVYELTKIDLNAYKEKQMKRRIDTLISRNKFEGYKDYVSAIRQNDKLFDEFVNYLTINVSEFYRNRDQWTILGENVFPELIQKFGNRLKIWSAACSSGEEPYSLVMELSQKTALSEIHILATDLDTQVIEKAKCGLYSEKSIASVPKDFKDRFFTQVGPSFQIASVIKNRVEYKQHNLLLDKFPTECDLIVCRNVLIYFTEEAKDEIFKKFYDSLKPGGILFIGSTEQIMNYKEIGYNRRSSFFYEKPAL